MKKNVLKNSVWRTVYDISVPEYSHYTNGTDGVKTVRMPITHTFKAGDEITIFARSNGTAVKFGDFVRCKHNGEKIVLELCDLRRLFDIVHQPDSVEYAIYSPSNGRYLRQLTPNGNLFTTLKCSKRNKSLELSVDWLNSSSGLYEGGDYFYVYDPNRDPITIPDDFEIHKIVNDEVEEETFYGPIRREWETHIEVYRQFGLFVAKKAISGSLPSGGYIRVPSKRYGMVDKKIFKERMTIIKHQQCAMVSFDTIEDILYHCIEFDCDPRDIILTEDVLKAVK